MNPEISDFHTPNSRALVALMKFRDRLENQPASLGGETRFARYTDSYIQDLAQEIPGLDRQPIPLKRPLPDMIAAYLKPSYGALVQVAAGSAADYNIYDGTLKPRQASAVTVISPGSNGINRGLFFAAIPEQGIKIAPFGDRQDTYELQQFVDDFQNRQSVLTNLISQLALQAAEELLAANDDTAGI